MVYLTGCGSDPLNGVQYGRDLGLKQMNTVFGIQHWFYKTCHLQVQYTHANPAKGKHFGVFADIGAGSVLMWSCLLRMAGALTIMAANLRFKRLAAMIVFIRIITP